MIRLHPNSNPLLSTSPYPPLVKLLWLLSAIRTSPLTGTVTTLLQFVASSCTWYLSSSPAMNTKESPGPASGALLNPAHLILNALKSGATESQPKKKVRFPLDLVLFSHVSLKLTSWRTAGQSPPPRSTSLSTSKMV